jgi:bifunctional non-homologous end joining protein LigD
MGSKTITLEAPSRSGGKFYSIDLVEARPGAFAVNFTHGAIGATGGRIKTGTKTPFALDFQSANEIYEDLIRQKVNGPSRYVPQGLKSLQFERVAPAPVDVTAVSAVKPLTFRPSRLLNDIAMDQIVPLTVSDDWWVQIKHDGDRVQLHFDGTDVTLFSGRSGKRRACPKPVASAMRSQGFQSFILDGELVGDTLWVFDVLEADGRDMTGDPLSQRYEWLLTLVPYPSVKISYAAQTHPAKVALVIKAKENHEEGVVYVNKNASYEAGRPATGGNNLRWKFKASASFLVSAHHPTKASMDVKLFGEQKPIGSVTMTGKERPAVGTVVEVEYLYCQSSLVQAVYKGVRTDVEPEACTRRQIQFKDGIDPMKKEGHRR